MIFMSTAMAERGPHRAASSGGGHAGPTDAPRVRAVACARARGVVRELRRRGWDIVSYADPSFALAEARFAPPDVLLLDATDIEELDSAIATLCAEHRHVRVVALHSHPGSIGCADVEADVVLGADDSETASRVLTALGMSDRKGGRTWAPVDLPSLRYLAELWARKASGLLTVGRGSGLARLRAGEPIDLDSAQLLEGAMSGGTMSFLPTDGPTTPGEALLGAQLYRTAREFTAAPCSADDLLHLRAPATRLLDLPLPEPLRAALLCTTGEPETVRALADRASVPPIEVLAALAALLVLGLATVSPPPIDRPAVADDRLPLARAMWSRLRLADPHQALGVAMDADADEVAAAAATITDTWEPVKRDRGAPDELRRLATDICGAASRAARSLQERPGPATDPLTQGRAALKERAYDRAVLALTEARDRGATSGDTAALLALAIMECSLPREQRRARAKQLVEEANALGDMTLDAELALLRVDVGLNRMERARHRLEDLLRIYPGHPQLKALLARMRGGR